MEKTTKEEIINKINEYASEHYNVHFDTEQFGHLEFMQFSIKDLVKIDILLKEPLDDITFVKKVIYGLIVDPKISLHDFFNISETELISIIRKIVEKNEKFKKFFSLPIEDDQVLHKFRSAVKSYYDEKVTEIKNNIEAITIPHLEQINQLLSTLVIPQINFYQSWIESNKQIFDKINKSFWSLQESLIKFDITIEEANKILIRYKWFVSPSLPTTFYKAVIKIEKSGKNKRKLINQLFIEYFSRGNYKELEELIENWKINPHYKPRMKIFRTCITTLKKSKSRENPAIVVIPVLIAQIEGIMNEIIAEYDIKQDLITKMWIDGKGNQSKKKKDAEKKLIASLNEYSPLGEYLLLEILFQKSIPRLSVPTTLSRHKILHGESLNFGRKDNTIRVFLILDFLNYLGEYNT